MSFLGLFSGAECTVPFNPLSQVLKHTEGDRSLQQDRALGSSSSRLHNLPGTLAGAVSEHDVALARQFFEGQGTGTSFAQLSHLPPPRLEMTGSTAPAVHEAWALEQQNHMRAFEGARAQGDWATEFGAPAQMSSAPAAQAEIQQRPSYAGSAYGTSMGLGTGMGLYGRSTGLGPYQRTTMTFSSDQKGKGKMKEADFEAAFAQVAASHPQALESGHIEEVNEIEEALRKATLETEGDSDFKKVWDHLQDSALPPPEEDLAKWEGEFHQMMRAQREELDQDYGSTMQNAWEAGLDEFPEHTLGGVPVKFDAEGLPILGDYVFEPENKYLGSSISSVSLLGDAKTLLEQNGSLSEAALLLEAAIQKGELGQGGYEAWILLGETRNMDEREEAGMRALMEGVKIAEESGDAGPGMLSLAISFTNESYDKASQVMLLRWLRARFPDHPVPEETVQAMKPNSSWDTHARVTDVFINLARSQNQQGIVNPEVQIGLGVLFYTNGEYEHAKDCFESALAVRPQDYLLWNRLGSSLSNGSKPEEALGAYREALQLRPTYTRAIYNVGVACLNIGAHKEAAEHFLSALTLQESTGGDKSEQLWLTLRRTFLSMDRPDLAELAKPESRTDLESFRREGFDF